MIVRIDDEGLFHTEGCDCCSTNYNKNFGTDRAKIIDELKKNLSVTREACKILGIDFVKFLNETP